MQSTPETPQAIEPWRSKSWIADHYEISTRTVNRWVASGCPSIMVGAERRFRLSEVHAWVTAPDDGLAEAA